MVDPRRDKELIDLPGSELPNEWLTAAKAPGARSEIAIKKPPPEPRLAGSGPVLLDERAELDVSLPACYYDGIRKPSIMVPYAIYEQMKKVVKS